MSETKRCTKCGEEKPLSRFCKHLNGLYPSCKDCQSKAYYARKASDPNFYRELVGRNARINMQRRELVKSGVLYSQKDEPKTCRNCSKIKPSREFEFIASGYHRRSCKECETSRRLEYYANRRQQWLDTLCLNNGSTKLCTKCQADKPLTEFYINQRNRLSSWCKECNGKSSEAKRKWNKRNRDRIDYKERWARRWGRLRLAGTIEKINRAAIIAQDQSTCYLCGNILSPGEVTLDHVIPVARGGTHTSDNLRVACFPCNHWKRDRLLSELPPRQTAEISV